MSTTPDLERLIKEYGDSVFRMCYLYLHDYHLAEDAVQETFIKALRQYHTFQGKSSEKTWLIRIAINICKNMMRTKWFTRLPLTDTTNLYSDHNFPENIIAKTELSKAILRLPIKDREVLLLYYYQELSIRETAQIIGKSENVTAQRLNRARIKLRELLKKEDFDYDTFEN